ncbi:MAG: hypothetical protein WCP22_02315, partial [Chlamydiota bacterium]
CGIFGVLVRGDADVSPGVLERAARDLFLLSESRGKEAAGLAAVTPGRIEVLKDAVPASDLVRTARYRALIAAACARPDRSPLAIIGHSRLVTDGAQETHANNQPVIAGGIVGLHNGIIVNGRALWDRFPALKREYDVDTEVLLRLIRMFLDEGETLGGAARKAFGLIEGAASVAVACDDADSLLLATNTGSLYLCESKSRRVTIFASERYILDRLVRKRYVKALIGPHAIRQLHAGSACLADFRDLGMDEFSLDPLSASPPVRSRGAAPRRRDIVDVVPPGAGKAPPARAREERLAAQAASLTALFPHDPEPIDALRRCTRCILPETMPFIRFDEKGVCNYCRGYARIGFKGNDALLAAVDPYRGSGANPDCIVSISGGRDSTYGLHFVKNVLGMTPIAYTYDWGMVTDLARRNISRICALLGIEHILISADIQKKRSHIRRNVEAWLQKPDLGVIPLFMAGDKHYFYYMNKLKKQMGIALTVYSENPLERTNFKSGFCGVEEKSVPRLYDISLFKKIKLAAYYARQFMRNPAYLNRSLWDTLGAFVSTYALRHDYLFLYDYIRWDEREVTGLLRERYDWEISPDTPTTWRIGDGTVAFYNYIYYTVAGFTENDTFRSNQIREGMISRDEALRRVREENQPRFDSIAWYCDTIAIDCTRALRIINQIPRIYPAPDRQPRGSRARGSAAAMEQ